ncbi:hypothetical protein ACIPR8_11155 [Stenotrophomonas sp. LARHCG68]
MSRKTTDNAKALAIVGTLGAIGLKAIEYQSAVEAKKKAAVEFGKACAKWKREHNLEFITKNSTDWQWMMHNIPAEVWALMSAAKRNERNARERLFRACKKAAHL